MSYLNNIFKVILLSSILVSAASVFANSTLSLADFELSEKEIYNQDHYISELEELRAFRSEAIAKMMTSKDQLEVLQSSVAKFLSIGVECGEYYNLTSMNLLDEAKGSYIGAISKIYPSLFETAPEDPNTKIQLNSVAMRATKKLVAFSKACSTITSLHLAEVTQHGRLANEDFLALNQYLSSYGFNEGLAIKVDQPVLPSKKEDTKILEANLDGGMSVKQALSWGKELVGNLYQKMYVDPKAEKQKFIEKNTELNSLAPQAKTYAQSIEKLSEDFDSLVNSFKNLSN